MCTKINKNQNQTNKAFTVFLKCLQASVHFLLLCQFWRTGIIFSLRIICLLLRRFLPSPADLNLRNAKKKNPQSCIFPLLHINILWAVSYVNSCTITPTSKMLVLDLSLQNHWLLFSSNNFAFSRASCKCSSLTACRPLILSLGKHVAFGGHQACLFIAIGCCTPLGSIPQLIHSSGKIFEFFQGLDC